MIVRRHFEVEETAVTIVAEEEFIHIAEESIFRSREIIQRFIEEDRLFQLTLEPYEPPEDAPQLIRRMCSASSQAEVGPMATVAGAIAEEAVQSMLEEGAKHAIIDNGGDLAMHLQKKVDIGIFAGENVKGLGMECLPRLETFGICTSSGTIGPSISFGIADAATVVSSNVALADACATKLGNQVKSDDDQTISTALDEIMTIKGVEGALVIVNGKIAIKGRLPKLIKADFGDDRISKIEY